jgi:hypothetical protein
VEFKLNKIDTDIRKKMQEEIKEDKIHCKNSITIKKDIKEDDNTKEDMKQQTNDEMLTKRFYTIDGIKYTKDKIQINAEKAQNLDEFNCKGINLNVKK